MYIFRVLPILFFCIQVFSWNISFAQSGQKKVFHVVQSGEGLYGISRTYDLSIKELKALNPGIESGLRVGQSLKLRKKEVAGSASVKKEHKVRSGETLYSLSRKYKVAVKDLKVVNKLTSSVLSKGDVLIIPQVANVLVESQVVKAKGRIHVVKSGDTFYSISRQYGVKVKDLYRLNKISTKHSLAVGEELLVGKTVEVVFPSAKKTTTSNHKIEKKIKKTEPIILDDLSISVGKFVDKNGKVREVGIAEGMNGSGNTTKYLALHKTAPAGTVIQVKNTMNNLSLFVRVIGNIPSVEANERVIIKITQKAIDRLAVVDNQFPVELNYIPNKKENL